MQRHRKTGGSKKIYDFVVAVVCGRYLACLPTFSVIRIPYSGKRIELKESTGVETSLIARKDLTAKKNIFMKCKFF